jgi:hypothetical protein
LRGAFAPKKRKSPPAPEGFFFSIHTKQESKMTKEERAKTARENGAKSKGPKTEAGKAKSARNALKDGARAKKYGIYVPAHVACLVNEDRQQYAALVDEFVAIYKPQNQAAFAIIGDMANARWQIDRLNRCITMHWNSAFIAASRKPLTSNDPELDEMKIMVDACADLLSGNSVLSKLNREIAKLQMTLARSGRAIKFIHANFPDFAPVNKQTEPAEEGNVAKEELNETEPEKTEEELPPIFTSEDTPAVIEAYKREFPGRRIVIVPQENVDYGDKTPRRPRRAA